MRTGSKLQVIAAFLFRLPLIALSALHLHYFRRYVDSDVTLLAVTDTLVVQQWLLTWSLVSATIPNMKAFMKSFSTDFGIGLPRGTTNRSGNSHPLQSIGKRSSLVPRPLHFRPDQVHHEAVVAAYEVDAGVIEDGTSSLRHNGSQEMIIRKDVGWDVSRSTR